MRHAHDTHDETTQLPDCNDPVEGARRHSIRLKVLFLTQANIVGETGEVESGGKGRDGLGTGTHFDLFRF